jgi:hypothetical protein
MEGSAQWFGKPVGKGATLFPVAERQFRAGRDDGSRLEQFPHCSEKVSGGFAE